MFFGNSNEFAIEAYHEPSDPSWMGFGRMCIHVQNIRLGNIQEEHCSLFHAVDRLREASNSILSLWDDSFVGKSDIELFNSLNRLLYEDSGQTLEKMQSDWTHFGRFNFLTNVGEQFGSHKTFIVCRPDGSIHFLYQGRDNKVDSTFVSILHFQNAISTFVDWFEKQITNPSYFPIKDSKN